MNLARFFTLLLCLPTFVFAQKADPVLFTVAGMPVHVSEFEYIYIKNNGTDANYSQELLEN